MDDIQYRLLGALYGFPTCCVRAFCTTYCSETKAHYPKGPWYGTGFIPCLSCAPAAAKDFPRFVAEKITPNRLYAVPFPGEPSRDTHDATMSFIAQLEMDQDEVVRPPKRLRFSLAHASCRT